LQVPVGREQMIGKYTYQFLEDTGFICLAELPSKYCVIKMPTVFVQIFGGRFKKEYSFFKTFSTVKYWQEWETFNYHYLPFRESLFKLTNSTMKLKELFAGALFTSSTGEIEVVLEDRSCHECIHQFPSNPYKNISCKDGRVISWDNTSVSLLNAPSAKAGDFITTSHVANSDELIQFHGQTKLEHKQRILQTRINTEHVKNQKSRELLPKTPKIRVITIIMVSVDLEHDIMLQDDIIYVSKSQFAQFYGEYCEKEANLASPTNVNVNIMSYDELTKFDRIGEKTARSLIEERKSAPFMNTKDLLNRVGKLPQYLEIKF
jgi:DNA uptake protein ComE-like DNA-binding protein